VNEGNEHMRRVEKRGEERRGDGKYTHSALDDNASVSLEA